MNVEVGRDIRITDCTEDMFEYFQKRLTFANPEYYKLAALGKWTGKTPKNITLLQRDKGDLIIPFGMLPEVFKLHRCFESISHSFPISDGAEFFYNSSVDLYDYQQQALECAINKRQGVIVAPCGAGKTQIGLMVAKQLGLRTLWLTHTSDLLNQSMERAKSIFDLRGEDYGTITAGKVNIGRVFTFATVQTMAKLDLPRYEDKWDCIIVDECHHVAGTPTKVMMFYKVISNLKARYKYGLTATPKRTDGLSGCMFALLGEKIIEIDKSAVENKLCPVSVIIRETGYIPNFDEITMPDGTLSYTALITQIVRDKDRNELIIDDVMNTNGTCLVLTERVEHVEKLCDMLKARSVSAIALSASASKKSKQERKEVIAKLERKEVKVLVATYALAKEGLDIPSLEHLFMATPQKNEIVVTQSAGRVARQADGKTQGIIHDYCDQFGLLRSWQTKRKNIYKKHNYILTI